MNFRTVLSSRRLINKRPTEARPKARKKQIIFGSALPVDQEETKEKLVQPSQLLKMIEYNGISVEKFLSDPDTKERLLGENDLMPVSYLQKGLTAAASVARITIVLSSGEEGYGTGFLVGGNLLLTNNHVLRTKEECNKSIAEFGYEMNEKGLPNTAIPFKLNPERFFITNKELDFTLVSVENISIQGENLAQFKHIPLIEKTGKVAIGSSVSIIQHPNGRRKSIALRNNTISKILENFLQYQTDTEPGSSGSPVFNDNWELVALHHSGVPKLNNAGLVLTKSGNVATNNTDESEIAWEANEGVRVSRIIKKIREVANAKQRILLEGVIDVSIEEEKPAPTPTDKPQGTGDNKSNTQYYDAQSDQQKAAKYYSTVSDGASQLFNKLGELLTKTHKKVLDYSPSRYLYPEVDIQENGKLRSIYSGKEFTSAELILADQRIDEERKQRFIELSSNENLMRMEDFRLEIEKLEASLPYNCEHVVPQSWFSKRNPMRGDLHHLFACEVRCNSFRSNIPYTDFENFEPVLNPEETERKDCGKREEQGFEPQNNQGVVARATLYYLLRYPSAISNNYRADKLAMLVSWHKKYPVSNYERRRNAKIAELQGNRNPLIDHPEWVDSIDFSIGL